MSALTEVEIRDWRNRVVRVLGYVIGQWSATPELHGYEGDDETSDAPWTAPVFGPHWVVTHTPTGRRINACWSDWDLSEEEARLLASEMHRCVPTYEAEEDREASLDTAYMVFSLIAATLAEGTATP